jgi:FAD:protein FMN transferase
MMPTAYFLFFFILSEPVHELKRYEYTEPHMGTVFHVQFYAESRDKADAAAKAMFTRVKHLNALFSDYQNDSELMQLCQKAGSGPVKVSTELYEILQRSNEWSESSGGAFDASVGPLVQLWRKARRTRQLPSESAIKAAKELVDFRAIDLLPDSKVDLKKPKMRLDLGGIAKGYAADEMQKTLKAHGITSACVAAGGDVCVSNRPPGKPGWVISIAPLEKTGKVTTQLLLENQAVSTSGDLEQYVEIDGVRYSHIVDTKTGLGLTTRMSCTVVATHGVDCDAADTAVCVMGHVKGMKMINQQPGMACVIVVKENDVIKHYTSNTWSKLVFQP